ncbi:hypothetical protein ACIQ6Y_13970 [Streptomyces sp. NPDC096205]|uniref:hypothetical protein n=1 Tax=Streptomyces sp. NPDC096205 TaxID=3366081 RepID=UPI003830C490
MTAREPDDEDEGGQPTEGAETAGTAGRGEASADSEEADPEDPVGTPEDPGSGRREEGLPDADPVSPSAPQNASPRPVAPQAGTPAEPMLHVLPLGSGMVLIGLGLALAFVGLRLRRG